MTLLKTARQRRAVSPRDLFVHKLRVGFHTAFGKVNTFVLFFLGDTDTYNRLEDAPDDQAGHKHPDKDSQRADKLASESRRAGYRYHQQTKQTHHTVHRNGT